MAIFGSVDRRIIHCTTRPYFQLPFNQKDEQRWHCLSNKRNWAKLCQMQFFSHKWPHLIFSQNSQNSNFSCPVYEIFFNQFFIYLLKKDNWKMINSRAHSIKNEITHKFFLNEMIWIKKMKIHGISGLNYCLSHKTKLWLNIKNRKKVINVLCFAWTNIDSLWDVHKEN